MRFRSNLERTVICFTITFLIFITFSFRNVGIKREEDTFEETLSNNKQEFKFTNEDVQIQKYDYKKERAKFNTKESQLEDSKITRLENDEEEIVFYTESDLEKAKIQIQRKEYLIKKYEFEIENQEREKEKPGKTIFEIEEENISIENKKKQIEKLEKEISKDKKYFQIKKDIVHDEDKIDLVYSWGGITQSMSIRNRYNYELQFSIRAVDKYLPWINKIYILINSDTTYPYWLKPQEELGKIVLLDRCQFFENAKDCPTYNSFAVYSVAHKIPGLSNKFILIDDDFFFNQQASEDYFFTTNGLPIVYQDRVFQRTYCRDDSLLPVAKEKGFPLWKYSRYTHRPKPNRRDFILKFEEQYPNFLEFVQSHRVRHKHLAEDLSVIYFEFYYQSNIMKQLPRTFSKFHQISMKHKDEIKEEFEENYQELKTQDIIVFNINDNFSKDYQIYKKQRNVLWNFYNKLYPEVPDFEIPNPDHEANT
ncbi:hypothetical protein M0812_04765 [Anaeramoeba flamelloides]|uniref:Stealth protein CR2 conserved region 2 domain-containing protein n=1 Tax=Anaeramoeba flamelloides TaxID=1746091 RepID=A0AAV8AFK6_9EUKA|nr:hypothetical protein M0812_04765 [Anaeramoeba flamelloides]